MKKLKYIIFSILIIIFILIIIIVKNNPNTSNNKDEDHLFNEGENEAIEAEETIQFNDYFIAKNCIQNYLDVLNKNNSIYYDTQDDGNQIYNEKVHREITYSLLNENFIKNKNISIENVLKNVEDINKKQRFYPIEIKKIFKGDVSSYKVYGIMQNLDYEEAKRCYYILDYSNNNNTFCIYPLDENTYKVYKGEKALKNIEEKEFNICNLEQVNTENLAVEYFEAYKFFTLADPQITYNMMTEEYRTKRFGSIDNYRKYIKDNYEEFQGIIAKKYLTNNTDKGMQYVIKDQYDNLYIFDIKDTIDYTIKLDTYTIDEEKFLSTYKNASESDRVQMNIGNFFDMINRHDYRSSYNCLAEEFKKNKFKNEQEFENAIQKDLFLYNTYEVKELKNIGANTYACKLEVTYKGEEYKGYLSMTIIMKLEEGTKFVMSYSMN